MIIGLGHTAQVGKDALADSLAADHGFVRVSFAETLRRLVYETDARFRALVDMHGYEGAKRAHPDAVRRPLIDVGNACRRIIGDDVWIRAAERTIDGLPDGTHVVISDVRYPNEAAWIRDRRGLLVKVTRPGVEPGEDVADQALALYSQWDRFVVNDGTLADLRTTAAWLADEVRTIAYREGAA